MIFNLITNFDTPSPWQLFFQNPATPVMEGIIYLHNYIFMYLILVFVVVLWFLVRSLYLFRASANSKPFEFTHDYTLESVWTIAPAFILVAIAIPSFSLLYSMDDVIDPYITVKAIGHQWYWSYEIDLFRVDDVSSIMMSETAKAMPEVITKKSVLTATEIHAARQVKQGLRVIREMKYGITPEQKAAAKILDVAGQLNSKRFAKLPATKSFFTGSRFLTKTRTNYFKIFDVSQGRVKQVLVAKKPLKNIRLMLKTPKPLDRFSPDESILLASFLSHYIEILTKLPLINPIGTIAAKIALLKMVSFDPSLSEDVDFSYLLAARAFIFNGSVIQLTYNELKMLEMLIHSRQNYQLSPASVKLALQDKSISDGFLPRVIFWRNPGVKFDSYMINEPDLGVNDLRLLSADNPLVLPVKTHIRLLVTSTDVIHSWSVPSFGVKVDAIPGRLNQTGLYIKRTGVFYGQCSELCGVNHGFMPITVKAVELGEFQQWAVDKQKVTNLDCINSKSWEIFIKTPNSKLADVNNFVQVKYDPIRSPFHSTTVFNLEAFKGSFASGADKNLR